MKITHFFLIITFLLGGLITKSQSLKDFIVPDSSKNKAEFIQTNNAMDNSTVSKTIYYVKKGNLLNINTVKPIDGKLISKETKIVQFSNGEMKLSKSITSTNQKYNLKKDFKPAKVLLKIPNAGPVSKWKYIEGNNDTISCTSILIKENVKGAEKQALQVTKLSSALKTKTIEIYVSGLGLWKTEIFNAEGSLQSTETLNSLSIDAKAANTTLY